MKRQRLLEILGEMQEKYFNLVWYARSDPECHPDSPDDIRAGCFMAQAQIESTYPKEVAELENPKTGAWTHGFNSGMLACLRYILTLFEDGVEAAEAEFPMLDT